MKKFITQFIGISLIFLITTLSLLVISSAYVKNKGFNNYTTESNTLWLTKNKKYDILFMGISHARNFTRHKNQERLEKILDSKIANIAQGEGSCGVKEQLFYLDYFYYKGNSASKIIYVLSPPMLFSETLPIASNTFKNEVFEFPFLIKYLSFDSENKNARIMSYLQYKLHPKWLLTKPFTLERLDNSLDSIDLEIVEKGQNLAYSGSSLNYKRFIESKKVIEQTILLAESNNTRVVFLIPPALFGKWRGHQSTYDFAMNMKLKYPNVDFFDASETILKPDLYNDNHHLNTKGVVYFTEKYLKDLIK
nr:hypothetical protein [uncultured Carboxylicivirga sp.]